MSKERNWFDVSFTHRNGKRVQFGEVSVTFLEKEFEARTSDETALLRISSSNHAQIPTFTVGTVGMFQGTRFDGPLGETVGFPITYSTSNAEVTGSKPGDLFLEAKSIDDVTRPNSIAIH